MSKSLMFSVAYLVFSLPLWANEPSALLKTYVGLHKALAEDKVTEAQTLASKAHTQLVTFLKSTSSPSEALKKMRDGAEQISQSKTDLDTRKAFGLYSEGAVGFVKANEKLKTHWELFYCPMVPKGTFGYWVQPQGESLLNPYYGAKMLTCGVKRPW
ncbi:MAG: DUF3347 domain-containing protein [Proteobacteria bacterium]|nr:DUF3347 domain-containing protein [Pseudomonadota bacterium]